MFTREKIQISESQCQQLWKKSENEVQRWAKNLLGVEFQANKMRHNRNRSTWCAYIEFIQSNFIRHFVQNKLNSIEFTNSQFVFTPLFTNQRD